MFGLGKKVEIKTLDINKAYQNYEENKEHITIICSDEQKDFDDRHIMGAECFPLRLMDQFEDYYPDKDMIYYFYAINNAISERACKKAIKKGYQVYHLGTFVAFKGKEEGLLAAKKHRRRR